MKKLNLKLAGTLALSLLTVSTFAQNWKQGGNGAVPAAWNVAIPANQLLGTTTNYPLRIITNNTERMHMNGTVTAGPPYNRSGFIGFNNSAPMFHLDITTPEPDGNLTYGELMFRARTFDDTVAYISFVNLATTGTTSLPTLLANQSNNPSTALFTVGNIDPNQDLAGLPAPATRFISSRNYDPAQGNLGLQRINVIQNRRLFAWYNAIDQLMTMEANGFLGIGTTNPGNRLELNSDFYNPFNGLPYGGGAGGGPSLTDVSPNGGVGPLGVQATGFSGLRFTDLTTQSVPIAINPGAGILTVDSFGDVIYVATSSLGSGFALCDVPSALTGDSYTNLANNNLYFTGIGFLGENHTGYGYACSTSLPAKLSVIQSHLQLANINSNTKAISGINIDVAGVGAIDLIGLYGESSGIQGATISGRNIGANLTALNAARNFGILIDMTSNTRSESSNVGIRSIVSDPDAILNYGAFLSTTGSTAFNTGVRSDVSKALDPFDQSSVGIAGQFTTTSHGLRNVGVIGRADYSGTPQDVLENFGVIGIAYGGGSNYGVYGEANDDTALPDYAGYFNGNVLITNALTVLSDENYKTNVEDVSDAMDLISQLSPKTFEYDQANHPNYTFNDGLHYGLIAQDVETVIPELVSENVHPAELDSMGNVLYPAETFKGLNYEELIPIMIKGMQEQQAELDVKDSIIENLNDRLTQLENCLSNILPALCNANQQAVYQTPEDVQNKMNEILEVELSDQQTIVLDQNVPNPFAERTSITYSVPATVQKAQIHFYNAAGQLINSVELTERGNGEIHVFANDLSTGIYTYSLVADGKIISTKRMMKQ